MPLDEDLDNAAGSLRDFEEALAAATDALGGISGDGAGGGGGGGADTSVGVGSRSGRGGGGGRLRGLAGAAAGAAAEGFAQGFGATGDVGVGLGGARRGLNAFAAQIPIAGGLFGFAQQEKILGRAEARVGALLANDARYGVEVSNEEIQQQLDVVLPQEKRAADVEARIRGITGDEKNAGDAGKSDALTAGFEKMFTTMDRIADALDGITGGANR